MIGKHSKNQTGLFHMTLFGLGLIAFLTGPFSSWAVTVAVVDSGVDTRHKHLSRHIWTNTQEGEEENFQDDDGNGYVDDQFGWNFAENNNQLLDYKFLGKFSPDVYNFFKIQSKMFKGTVTSEDLLWVRSVSANPDFKKSIMTFGNFIHGTHVAGITVNDESTYKVLPVKIIPTEVKVPGSDSDFRERLAALGRGRTDEFRRDFLKNFLKQAAVQQAGFFQKVVSYLKELQVDIFNGSFGLGYFQARGMVQTMFVPLFGRAPSEEEADSLSRQFLNQLLQVEKEALDEAPEILFVFAAGNDASDNDRFPVSPANTPSANLISVGATQGVEKLAKFSNYGKEQVHIAAPGVAILSSIPGDEYIEVSGTSQAAPYVAHVAALMKTTFPQLSAVDMKALIMLTADMKDFLSGKISAGGIVNHERAVRAAYLRQFYGNEEAAEMARQEIGETIPLWGADKSLGGGTEEHPLASQFILPLPTGFVFR